MISFEEACAIVMGQTATISSEHVGLPESAGRVLAENIVSDIDMPPFRKSAVDGFACREEDLGSELLVLETIPAGTMPRFATGKGECSRIMTGAKMPEGSDCVIMTEDTIIMENGRVQSHKLQSAANFCAMGEDIRKGQNVLTSGTLIKPQHIAVLASTGTINPKVARRPRVGILSTGDELVEPEFFPEGAKIRNTNSYQLAAQVNETGCIARYEGIAADTPESLAEKFSHALDLNDIVLLSGGVSMGQFDYVPAVMKKLGINILFEKIKIQPGKPTVFGIRNGKFIFGLPGNPVSSFVVFEILVKPFLLSRLGCKEVAKMLRLPAGADINRKKTERKAFVPVKIEPGGVFPVEYHGSAHINAYTLANGILTMEIGVQELKKGEYADVRPV